MKWGIIGTGYIAGQFASGMRVVKDAEIVGVVSRHPESSGAAYAEEFHVKRVYASLQEMIDDAKPEVIYVATPNDCHYSAIMQILDAGLPVLSEKPIVDSLWQLENVLEKAAEKNLFLMEGMWTRCFPAVRKVREWIAGGRIGEALTVRASFDIKPDVSDWQPWKGGIAHSGGSLRDVGIYSLAMAKMVFPQKPEKICATMHFNGEVDDASRLMLIYEDGKTAFVSGAFNQISNPEVEIVGEYGTITLGPELWHPRKAALVCHNGQEEHFFDPYPETGFQYEIRAVQEAIAEGKTECPFFTHSETRDLAELIEEVRKSWGITYASDK